MDCLIVLDEGIPRISTQSFLSWSQLRPRRVIIGVLQPADYHVEIIRSIFQDSEISLFGVYESPDHSMDEKFVISSLIHYADLALKESFGFVKSNEILLPHSIPAIQRFFKGEVDADMVAVRVLVPIKSAVLKFDGSDEFEHRNHIIGSRCKVQSVASMSAFGKSRFRIPVNHGAVYLSPEAFVLQLPGPKTTRTFLTEEISIRHTFLRNEGFEEQMFRDFMLDQSALL